MKSVRAKVEKYGGDIKWEKRESCVIVSVIFFEIEELKN